MTTTTSGRQTRRWSVWIATGVLLCSCAESGTADTPDESPPPVPTSAPDGELSTGDTAPTVDSTGPAGSAASTPASTVESLPPATEPSTAEPPSAELCPDGEYPAFGALDQQTGALEWSTCSPDEAYRSIVGASDEIVVVRVFDGGPGMESVVLDAQDGTELWRLSTVSGPGGPPGPVDSQGIVVLETDLEGTPFVMGADAMTGTEVWRLEPGESVIGSSDEVVVVARSLQPSADPTVPPTGGLRGIDRATGSERWATDLLFAGYGGSPVTENTIAVQTQSLTPPSMGLELTALDLATGEILWSAPPLENASAADGVIVGSVPMNGPLPPASGPSMRAIDGATGADLWAADGSPSYGVAPAMGEGVLVHTTPTNQPNLVASDLFTGEERWAVPAMDTPGQPQLVSAGSVVLLWESYIGVLSAGDGSLIWEAIEPLRSPLMNSVGSNGTSVFVAVNSLPWGD